MSTMALDIRHLRLLVAIADEGSLSGAARLLGVRQPSVTTQLQRIESHLGGALFERTASGVRPTARGEATLRRARQVLSEVDTVAGLVRDPLPHVRVRTFVLPFEFLLPVIDTVAPGVQWEITTGGYADGLEALASGDADLYVGLWWPDRPTPPGIVVEEMLRDSGGWVLLPATHPLAGDAEVPLRSLASERFALPPEPELQQVIVEDCRRAGFEPTVQVRAGDFERMIAAVRSRGAVAITSPLTPLTPDLVVRPCPDTCRASWALAHRNTQPAGLLEVIIGIGRWSYVQTARANPELFASLPRELVHTPYPEPFAPEHPEG